MFQRILKKIKEKKCCEALVDGIENKIKKIGLWKMWSKNGMHSKEIESGRKQVVRKRKQFWNFNIEKCFEIERKWKWNKFWEDGFKK